MNGCKITLTKRDLPRNWLKPTNLTKGSSRSFSPSRTKFGPSGQAAKEKEHHQAEVDSKDCQIAVDHKNQHQFARPQTWLAELTRQYPKVRSSYVSKDCDRECKVIIFVFVENYIYFLNNVSVNLCT